MAANLIKPSDGVLQAKFNTGSDDWSAILPCVDRQKYTIGDKYTSWDTQGNFIFFRPEGPEWNWKFGLEILCDDGFYSVKPATVGGRNFLNGAKLNREVGLNFGDIFTVTKLRNDISGGLANFTFEKRSYIENWDDCKNISDSENTTGSNFILDRNQLVFSIILSRLSLHLGKLEERPTSLSPLE